MTPAIVGVVSSVTDGDTLRLATGQRIRLAAVDANERDGRCHARCAPMSASAATASLRRLALGRRVACETVGTSYRRIVAWCSVGSMGIPIDLSCAQLRAGAAVYVARYDRFGRMCRG